MGRKWTNMKFDIGYRDKEIDEASHSPRTREEALFDYIREEFGEENLCSGVENVDVMFGDLDKDGIKERVNKVIERFDFAERAAVVYITDSAHVGQGWVLDERGIVEKYKGYEGAEGYDVCGEIGDNHNMGLSPAWYWD